LQAFLRISAFFLVLPGAGRNLSLLRKPAAPSPQRSRVAEENCPGYQRMKFASYVDGVAGAETGRHYGEGVFPARGPRRGAGPSKNRPARARSPRSSADVGHAVWRPVVRPGGPRLDGSRRSAASGSFPSPRKGGRQAHRHGPIAGSAAGVRAQAHGRGDTQERRLRASPLRCSGWRRRMVLARETGHRAAGATCRGTPEGPGSAGGGRLRGRLGGRPCGR